MIVLLTASMAIGLLVLACPSTVAAEDSFVTTAAYSANVGDNESGVRTVSYSTGKTGRKLKWLPCRPSKPHSNSRRPAAKSPAAEQTSSAPVKTVQWDSVDPFDDPFEDAHRVSQAAPPRLLVTDEVLQGAAAPQTLPGLALPQLAPDDSTLDTEASQEPEKIPEGELEELLAAGPAARGYECPSPADLKSIHDITIDIGAEGEKFPQECTLGDEVLQPRAWASTTFTWKASGLCHKPLYFEEVHLERYGHSWGPYLQPVISGAHFFLTVPILPYKMGLYPPHECIYTLGYYRPGSCAPYLLDPLPLSIRAGLAEAGVWTGMVYLIP